MRINQPTTASQWVSVVATIISTLIFLAFTLNYLLLFILTGVGLIRFGMFLCCLGYYFFMLILGPKHHWGFIFLEVFLIFIGSTFLSAWSTGFSSKTQWRYGFQKKYIENSGSSYVDYFPDKLPEFISYYSFDYQKAVMQGDGHASLSFIADDKLVDKYIKEYSKDAIYTFEVSKGANITPQTVSPEAIQEVKDDTTLRVYFDEDFWGADKENATVYVFSAVHYFNHPSSSALIIDKKTNKIQFGKYSS